MYDHFDMEEPMDVKFLADMFIVQKEYRKAFLDYEGGDIPGGQKGIQQLVDRIEQCIDKLWDRVW